MERSRGRTLQIKRTASAKALGPGRVCGLQEWKEASVAGAGWLMGSLERWKWPDPAGPVGCILQPLEG